jgi:predicted nucleic acid-binding protein
LRRYVVDASVAVKWMMDEAYSAEAQRLLKEMRDGEADLLAPTILKVEVANALNTYTRRRGVDPGDAAEALKAFAILPLTYVDTDWDALVEAFEVSISIDLAVYDAVYLILARRSDAALVTMDDEIVSKARDRFEVKNLKHG